jgi:hypothetical protein
MKAFANALLDSRRAAAAVGPNRSRPWSLKRSATPRLNGSSGPGEIDLLAVSESQGGVRVGEIDGRRAGELGNTGIPGRDQKFTDITFGSQPGDERVLARTAAENEKSHIVNDLGR